MIGHILHLLSSLFAVLIQLNCFLKNYFSFQYIPTIATGMQSCSLWSIIHDVLLKKDLNSKLGDVIVVYAMYKQAKYAKMTVTGWFERKIFFVKFRFVYFLYVIRLNVAFNFN